MGALVSPWAPRLLLGAWFGLFIAATQLPQAAAPLPTTDGLSNADLGAIAALGLGQIGDSLLLWLLVAASITVAFARLLFRAPALLSLVVPTSVLSDGLRARIESNLAASIAATPWRVIASVRTSVDGSVRRIEAGLRGPGMALLAIGVVALIALTVWTSRAPASVVIDVPVASKVTPAPVAAFRVDRGRWVKATGHFEAGCALATQTLTCVVEAVGERANVTLQPGASVPLGERTVAWTATAVEPTARRFRFDWWAPATGDSAPKASKWFAFDVRDGRHATVSALGASLSTFATTRSGPIAIGVSGKGPRATVFVAAGPALLPTGKASVRSHAAPRVRLRIDPPFPIAAFMVALLAILIGVLLTWGVPAIRVDVAVDAGRVRIISTNRAALRDSVVFACGVDEGSQLA